MTKAYLNKTSSLAYSRPRVKYQINILTLGASIECASILDIHVVECFELPSSAQDPILHRSLPPSSLSFLTRKLHPDYVLCRPLSVFESSLETYLPWFMIEIPLKNFSSLLKDSSWSVMMCLNVVCCFETALTYRIIDQSCTWWKFEHKMEGTYLPQWHCKFLILNVICLPCQLFGCARQVCGWGHTTHKK
jgi:hypothetical protein